MGNQGRSGVAASHGETGDTHTEANVQGLYFGASLTWGSEAAWPLLLSRTIMMPATPHAHAGAGNERAERKERIACCTASDLDFQCQPSHASPAKE
eukprot:915003-Rhodomonas_salina.1